MKFAIDFRAVTWLTGGCLSTVRYVIDFNFASITLALWLTAEWTSLSPVATSYLWPVLFAEVLNYVFIT